MNRVISPLCLFLALAMLIAGFAMVAVGVPEANVQLHQARASGDDRATESLERHLRNRRMKRNWMIGGLFAGSIAMFATAHLSMRPSHS